jgi:photosystem II stability/assembly factor-like uncharacterized protein
MSPWREYPPVDVASPVLALAGNDQTLWAGGAGGIARYQHSLDAQQNWVLQNAGLTVPSVSALCFTGSWLIAGGIEGITRSGDGGQTWQPIQVQGKLQPVTAIVASPTFDREPILLASTLGSGILRSEDAGTQWRPSNFGLQNGEVSALAWRADGAVLAATGNGIYLSNNEGRAWRATHGSDGKSFSSIVFLTNGRAVASLDDGGLLISNDSGATWEPLAAQLPEDVQILSLQATGDGALFLGTAEQGTLRSTDGGQTWLAALDEGAITLAEVAGKVYAGLTTGEVVAIHPEKSELPRPPLHDLRFLLVLEQRPMVAGLQSGLWMWSNRQGWKTPTGMPELVTALAVAPDGGLILAGPDGMYRSTDQGKTWEGVYSNAEEVATRLTFRANGWGWAGTASGNHVLYTRNNGRTWELLDAPFRALPLAALQAAPEVIIAATYDNRMGIAQLWYSEDDARTWKRGAEVRTPWPVIATNNHPPVFSLGGVLFILRPNGTWLRQTSLNQGMILRLAGNNHILYALTTAGLFSSSDNGETWTVEVDCPPVNVILDLTIEKDTLYLLLVGGKVWSKTIDLTRK